MLNIFSSLIKKKGSSNKNAEGNTEETKKCLRCLRRIALFYDKCPHCRTQDFQYDS